MIKLKLTSDQQRKLARDLKRIKCIQQTIGALCASFQNQIPFKMFCDLIQDVQTDIDLCFLLHAEITIQKLIIKMSS